MSDSAQLEPSDLLADLTSSLLRSRPDLSGRLAEEVSRRVPAYRDPSLISEQELRESCEAHVAFVSSTGTPDRERDDRARAIGAARARAEMPLADLFDAIRVGSAFIWSEIVAFARSAETASDTALVTVASQVWAMSDDFVTLTTSGYRLEQDLRLINSQRERYVLIDTVLSGHDQSDPTLWQAIDRLGLSRDHTFVVAAVETVEPAHVPTPRIDRLLLETGQVSVWLLRADVELGIVTCDHDQVDSVRSALGHYQVRAGISPLVSDFGHAPQAVRLARTAMAAAEPGQVRFFADAAVNTMAAGAPDVARELAAIVLYRVLNLHQPERDLVLDTVRQYFAAGGSVADTSQAMFVHPNTVRNRLRRFESLTLRSLSDPRQSAELYLAVVSLSQGA